MSIEKNNPTPEVDNTPVEEKRDFTTVGSFPPERRRRWVASIFVMSLVLVLTIPTAGDMGLTWDEPAYRFSQSRSAQWWERLSRARTTIELRALFEPDALLFYWTYGRHGINFHPPLGGQLNLLTYELFGRWMNDVPARRMSSILEYALTIAILFGFLSRRYGFWVGTVAAGCLLLMPRVYGDGHIAATDTPGLLLWAATTLAFWKGLHEPDSRRWRILVGVLVGLCFAEKMAAVFVLGPLLFWLVAARLPGAFRGSGGSRRASWIDGVATTAIMLAPLVVALGEMIRLTRQFAPPKVTDLFRDRPVSHLPGVILAIPLAVWAARRILSRTYPRSAVWGVERPALEIWTAILAFGPFIGWLGNPAWWRETMPRLAHYLMINVDRKGSLPDIAIFYLGHIYEFSLPWHNGWVMIAVTVPTTILAASVIGQFGTIRRGRRDPLRLFFAVNLLCLPAVRMLPTPAHDGVRLLLPTFFYLAAMAGWGTMGLAEAFARGMRGRSPAVIRSIFAGVVLIPAAWQLIKIHPYELSYYNELIGGPREAWRSGFELTYWYDAFTPKTIEALNRTLPRGAEVDFLNSRSNPMTFFELQRLGHLRADVVLGWPDLEEFRYLWLLTQDSKASGFTRLLFAMTPWFAETPRQLDGARVVTVADPVAVSRAWALSALTESSRDRPVEKPYVPRWVRNDAPFLRRLWGDGLTRIPLKSLNEPVFSWATTDPEGLRASARRLADKGEPGADAGAQRLMAYLTRGVDDGFAKLSRTMLRKRPEALIDAVEILIRRPDAVRAVLDRESYTDMDTIGGTLDRDLPR